MVLEVDGGGLTRGPHWTGAPTSGGKTALFKQAHGQSLDSVWGSVFYPKLSMLPNTGTKSDLGNQDLGNQFLGGIKKSNLER